MHNVPLIVRTTVGPRSVVVGVHKVKQRLGLSEAVRSVQQDNIWCLHSFARVTACCNVNVELGRRQRCEERRGRRWDADTVGSEKSLCAIEALGRQLVVSKGPQELTHKNVSSDLRLPSSHVGGHDCHTPTPLLCVA
jgi:hypothetical protein